MRGDGRDAVADVEVDEVEMERRELQDDFRGGSGGPGRAEGADSR